MIMTLKKSLIDTSILWRGIYERSDLFKPSQTTLLYGCPCCEYVAQKIYGKNWQKIFSINFWYPVMIQNETGGENIKCARHCPLFGLWGRKGCQSQHSPYREWAVKRDLNGAKDIADYADMLLEKLYCGHYTCTVCGGKLEYSGRFKDFEWCRGCGMWHVIRTGTKATGGH